jgi:hypothetical protein
MGLESSLLISSTDFKFKPTLEQLEKVIKVLYEMEWFSHEKIWNINCPSIYTESALRDESKPLTTNNIQELLKLIKQKYILGKEFKIIPVVQTHIARDHLESFGTTFSIELKLESSALKIGKIKKSIFVKYGDEYKNDRDTFIEKTFAFCIELMYVDIILHPDLYNNKMLEAIMNYPFMKDTLDGMEKVCNKKFAIYKHVPI